MIAGIKAKTLPFSDVWKYIRGDAPDEALVKPKDEDKKSTDKEKQKIVAKWEEVYRRHSQIMKPFFAAYDANGDGTLSPEEAEILLVKLKISDPTQSFKSLDTNHDEKITFEEFSAWALTMVHKQSKAPPADTPEIKAPAVREDDEDDDEEEEEMPEDLADMSEGDRKRVILRRAFQSMGFGTILVLLFSDPMVDVLGEWGNRFGISGFYVSFVLAPFASNASELIAAQGYASKRTQKHMITSLSTLVGAACMNNTFVLAIFYALIYCKGLAWQFTAETVAIIVTQWLIGLAAIKSDTQTFALGIFILCCYPLCLFIVYALENFAGLD